MNIGIDIDGTLTNISQFQLDYGSKFFSKYDKYIENPSGFESNEVFNVDNNLDDKFWDEYYIKYLTEEPPRKFASEIIQSLKNEGNKIYIITARHSERIISIEENKKITEEWLKKNNILFDNLIFSPEDKLEICLNNHIDIMIEDKPTNINRISSKIPVICMHSEYNKDCKGHNINVAYSWYDIYHKIKLISNLKEME